MALNTQLIRFHPQPYSGRCVDLVSTGLNSVMNRVSQALTQYCWTVNPSTGAPCLPHKQKGITSSRLKGLVNTQTRVGERRKDYILCKRLSLNPARSSADIARRRRSWRQKLYSIRLPTRAKNKSEMRLLGCCVGAQVISSRCRLC